MQQSHAAENADRHGKIESRTFLLDVCRREVDGDVLIRKRESIVADRRHDAIARLADCGIGQSDNREASVVSSREIHFDIDKMSLDAKNRGTPSFEKHGIFRVVGLPKGDGSLAEGHLHGKRGFTGCDL